MDAHRCEMSLETCEFMEFVYVLEKRWAANLSHAVMVEIYTYTVVGIYDASLLLVVKNEKNEKREKERKIVMQKVHMFCFNKEMPRCPLSVCLAVFVWENHTSGREVPLLRFSMMHIYLQ